MVFEAIRNWLTGSGQRDRTGIYFYVKCGTCGTPLEVRVDRTLDLQRDFEQGGYVLHKEVMDGTCFRLFHFTVRFDGRYNVVERQIEGGEFITEDEYHALTRPETES